MTKGRFHIHGLGDCLVGTYALRNLTKQFNCSTVELFTIGLQNGYALEFNSYLLKFASENASIQGGNFKEKSIYEIDTFLDEHELSEQEVKSMYDALCVSITGMTQEEFAKKIQAESQKSSAEAEEVEKKIGSTTGE